MAQTIKLKRTATPSNKPTIAQLELGEIAVNTYDGKVYIKKTGGGESVVEVTTDHTQLPKYIEGTGATGAWTGTHPEVASYTDGLIVWYKINFNGASTTTLNINGLGAKTIYRYATSKLTTHWPINSIIPLVYSATLNGGCFVGGYGYDTNQTYDLRWSSSVVNGTSTIHGYQLLMEGADTKFYPVTVGGVANSTTNTVQTAPLRMGGQMLYYSSTTDVAPNAVIADNVLYESVESAEGEYWMNRSNSSSWTAAGLPIYIVGTVDANNHLILDNSTTTAFLTNALPTTADGKVYIHVGYSDNEDDVWRLSVTHPIYEFKAGEIRRYEPPLIASEVLTAIKTVDGESSGLDADLLDGQQGSYYATADSVAAIAALDPVITLTGAVTGTGTMTNLGSVSIATTATSDPVLTLTGDVTGTATFTNLGNATLTAVVADDSHNHIISNVDGLQTALDAKLNLTGGTVSGTLTLDNGGASSTSLVMKGTSPTISFLDDDTNADDFYIHVTSNKFYILANRTDAEVDLVGTGWENPYPMYLDSAANTGYLFDQRMFSDSYHPNADTLTTARTINGVSFNGSADITVADATKLPLSGGTLTGALTIGSTGLANAPVVRINNSSANTFVHSFEAFSPNLTANQSNILVVGEGASTKNSGYIGYNWAAAGSNSNYVTIGHWGADHLVKVYGDGATAVAGTVSAPTFNATSTASGGFQGIDADTITAPSFTWTSDLNTGMWHAGTDQIGFTTGGTNRLTVSTTAVTSTLNVAAPTFSGSGASLSALNGSNITTGTVAAARVATLNQNTTGSSGSCTGNAATATKLSSARTFALTGDVTGSVSSDLTSGASIVATVENDSHDHSELNRFINGEGTVAGTWLGTDSDITSYYDGLVIWYRITINGASTTTLNINGLGAKTIYRYATAKLTTHWPVGSVIPLVYSTSLNGGSFIGGYDWSDGTESYTVRWNQVAKNGSSIIHGYQLLMQGVDNLMYPVTVGGAANSTTNVVQTAELRMGGQMLYYNSATDIAANGNISGSILYEGITSGEMEYWSNRSNSTPWATAYLPMYLVGTVNANGNIILDNSTTTAFLTQTLPTTDDGKVYIQIGWMGNTTDNWRLSTHHPVFEFKDGSIRLYQKEGAIAAVGNSTVRGVGSTGNAFQVFRGSDGAGAFRVMNTGEVIVSANYFYVDASQGSYFSSSARFRGTISNDTGTDVTIGDTLNVTEGIKLNATTVIDSSRNLTNIGTIGASGTVTAPTFNATSTASGGFQGIDADTITAPSFTWTSDLNTGMWHAAADQIGFTTGGVNRVTITSTGITAVGDVTAYSDMRLKENIEVIPNAVSKVQQLRGVTFTRNDAEDLEKRHTGVIAQEVEAVLPEAVSEDNAGIKNVAYGNMVGLLIEAIKELKSEVDDLKAQLVKKENTRGHL